MKYKDILIRLASMTVPYVYDNTISFLELDRKLYKIVHELIVAMQGLNADYEQFKSDMTDSFNEFTATINNNFDDFKTDVNNQITTFEVNMNTNFESFKTEINDSFNNFKTEIEGSFNTLEGEFNTLKTYVDNYFSNLNLDEEVQTVIQKMVDDGTLANIINNELLTDINNQITQINQEIEQLQNNEMKSLVVKYSAQVKRNVYYNSELNNSAPIGTILYVTLDGAPTQPTSKVQIGSSISSTDDLYDKDNNLVYGNMVKDNMNLIIIKDVMKWRLINTLPSEYDTSALEEQIEQNTSNITSLQSQVTTNTANISNNTKALDIMNTQTSITDENIDFSGLIIDNGTDDAYSTSCNVQISANEDNTRYLVTGLIQLYGNPGYYSGNIKIPLNNEGTKTGKSFGCAFPLNPLDGYHDTTNRLFFTTSVTETHLIINIPKLKLSTSDNLLLYLPMIGVIYE